jgi:hypothetical protein
MTAWINGEDIQYKSHRGDDYWTGLSPDFNCWAYGDYRIKPKPKNIWVNETEGEKGIAYLSAVDAAYYTHLRTTRTAVHYREVVKD